MFLTQQIMHPISGKLSHTFEQQRAGLYGILPSRQDQGLSREMVEDLADARPDDEEEESKERMIKVVTRGDLGMLRKSRTISGKIRETDFIHIDNLGVLQDTPNLSGPTSYNYVDTLNNAIESAKKRGSLFTMRDRPEK
jgi:hypothetical protein